jgi:hypothetical protein
MTLIVIPPIEVSITISFFPNNELLLLELDKKGYEEIVFDNKIKQNSKFFETKFEKSIEITRLIPANEHHEKIKLFSIFGFIPGKKQRVSIVSLSIDKEKKVIEEKKDDTEARLMESKFIKEILKKYIPEHLINRPKMGFGIPLEAWLRGPLKEWADDLLNEKVIKESGMLNPKVVKQKWEEHISGKRNWHYQLWAILMIQAWYKENF